MYRLESAKEALESAKILINAESYKAANFSNTLGKRVAQAEEIRHASDYDDFYIATRNETEEQISTAEEFIRMAEKYCQEQLKNTYMD